MTRGAPLVAVAVLLVLAPMAAASQVQRYEGPIVDVHLHAESSLPPQRFCFPQPCRGLPTALSDPADLLPATIAAMDELNIVAGVVSGDRLLMRAWMEGNEDRFIAGWLFQDPENRVDRIRALVESDSLEVIGELTAQYGHIAADDPRMDPIYAVAHELDLPIHIHVAGLGGSEDFPTHLGNPQRLAPVLAKYPGLRIYIENAGWPYLEEITSLMYQYPSVYADISTILHLTPRETALRYVEGLVDNGLGKRIMFGSDQMSWPEVMEVAVEALQGAYFLSVEQKADIFYNNAARFFRFTPEQIRSHRSRLIPD